MEVKVLDYGNLEGDPLRRKYVAIQVEDHVAVQFYKLDPVQLLGEVTFLLPPPLDALVPGDAEQPVDSEPGTVTKDDLVDEDATDGSPEEG